MTPGANRRHRLRSMRVSDGFKSYVLDQLEGLGDVTPRAMFGGVGLYCSGVFFGILASDIVYLKVDDGNRSDYQDAGSRPFTPYAARAGTMQYWAVPLDVLESAPELVEWARRAVAAAERAQTGRTTRKPARAGGRRHGRRMR